MNLNLKRLGGWQGDILAVVAGILMPFAFAPYNFSFLALISLVLIMLCWSGISTKRAFARGWLFGLGMFGFGLYWVHISMNQFGGLGVPLSVFLTALFVMFYALFPAITGYIARRFADRGEHQIAREYLLIVPAVWVMFEWIKGFLFTGMPWLSVGYSQIDLPVSGYAPVFGVFGVSYAVALSAGFITYWLLSGLKVTKIALPALLMLWIVPSLLNQVEWSVNIDEPIQVSLIQGNIPQDQKWLYKQRQPTLDLYTRLSRENWASDLVVWPETAIPATYDKIQPFLKTIAQEARMNSSELLVGLPVYNAQDGEYFNSMLSLGSKESFYDKTHLVPFGEFLPMKSVLGGVIDFFDIPMSDFTPGKQEKPLLFVAGQQAGISICYEDSFGEEIAKAIPEATFLINASNDAWFGDTSAPHQHLQIARMRSLETARYMVRSTNTGVSAIIDNKGNIKSSSPQFQTHVLTDKIQPMTGMTPFAVFTNMPIVVITFMLLGIAFWLGRKPTVD
ncbi:MAG: apolipoprotein N-acyltransferase [Gammaproteobacteria bacterium]|nr:apolipoprotein N-acyltransferase [Gammaproteobacteria bacterium]